VCDPYSGECVFNQLANCCINNEDCYTDDLCQVAECQDGQCYYKPKVCDDENRCTEDSCDPETGACRFEVKECDDGDACTIDNCDADTGLCKNEPVVCEDEDQYVTMLLLKPKLITAYSAY
jgi:hypothetical protein